MPESRDPVDALMRASRALLGVAARSLVLAGEEVSLSQYRVLALLATRGPLRAIDVAAHLQVNPSSATRLIDRLDRAGLISRDALSDRRSYEVGLSSAGQLMVDEVTMKRREDFERLLAALPAEKHHEFIEALQLVADAIGEVPEDCFLLGLGWP